MSAVVIPEEIETCRTFVNLFGLREGGHVRYSMAINESRII